MLTQCPDCGHQVSSDAPSCPGCGKPMPSGGWPVDTNTQHRTEVRTTQKAAPQGCIVKTIKLFSYAIVGFVVLVVAIAFFHHHESQQGIKLPNYASNAGNSSSSPAPSASLTVDGQSLPAVEVSRVKFAVVSANSSPDLVTQYKTFVTHGHFITVVVALMNKQHSAVTMGDSEFRLIASNGTRYSASSDDIYLQHSAGLLNQLNPGILRIVKVAFNVPRNIGVSDVSLRVQGGMTGDTALIPLS